MEISLKEWIIDELSLIADNIVDNKEIIDLSNKILIEVGSELLNRFEKEFVGVGEYDGGMDLDQIKSVLKEIIK